MVKFRVYGGRTYISGYATSGEWFSIDRRCRKRNRLALQALRHGRFVDIDAYATITLNLPKSAAEALALLSKIDFRMVKKLNANDLKTAVEELEPYAVAQALTS
jgi:hypothetical protein